MLLWQQVAAASYTSGEKLLLRGRIGSWISSVNATTWSTVFESDDKCGWQHGLSNWQLAHA
jgi:hypothetical protein